MNTETTVMPTQNATHTPGPWFADARDMTLGSDDILSISIYSGSDTADDNFDGVCVATVSAFGIAEVDENVFSPSAPDDAAVEVARSNARLISAAPELLDALKAICDEQDANEGYAAPATYDAARAAIAKATGAA